MMDRNSLMILAVLTLSVSNLLVGLATKNTYLVLASSGISAVLAGLYYTRSQTKPEAKPDKHRQSHAEALARRRIFPLWAFGAFLFMVLPAVLVFLQSGTGTA